MTFFQMSLVYKLIKHVYRTVICVQRNFIISLVSILLFFNFLKRIYVEKDIKILENIIEKILYYDIIQQICKIFSKILNIFFLHITYYSYKQKNGNIQCKNNFYIMILQSLRLYNFIFVFFL